MKKKMIKKQSASKRAQTNPIGYIQIISITFVLAIVVLVGTLTIKAIARPTVLGTNIGPAMLADQGENQGPDDSQQQPPPPPSGQPLMHQSIEGPQGHFEMQTEGNKHEINMQTGDSHFEMKSEDNGTLHFQNKREMVEIGSSSADEFSIKSGGIRAKTRFPLSVNPTTNQLTVTTPAGVKAVTVLPNQAVQNLLQKQILSSVQSSSSGAATNTISLTQVNNQPAFAVQGTADKKLFGLFPVAVDKTVYVSAQNGSVLQIQESVFNKFLETLSF